jgi:hypothetical protein
VRIWIIMDDTEMIKKVLDSDEFKCAYGISQVRGVIRRALLKDLIDAHLEDSKDARIRHANVEMHLSKLACRILREFDGIILPEELLVTG